MTDYRRAFKIACELLNGDVLYGIDADTIFKIMMNKDGMSSSSSYEEYILSHLQDLDHGQYAIEALEQEPTTKNNLGVDAISRAEVNQVIEDYMDEQYHVMSDRTRERAFGANAVMARINELSSVTPQQPMLDKIRAEIAEYGSIWVEYAITGHSDRDIENLIEGVLKQAKEQVLDVIDKYKAESEHKE